MTTLFTDILDLQLPDFLLVVCFVVGCFFFFKEYYVNQIDKRKYFLQNNKYNNKKLKIKQLIIRYISL